MNKTFNINLGGLPFVIDDDAYEFLTVYLKAIHKHFIGSESYKDITNDIEARLAELLQERLGTRVIVVKDDIKHVINTMGRPEDFGAEPMEETSGDGATSDPQNEYRTGKKLFRDPENTVLGGVCSGIAAYFGIQDPLWVRLTFLLFVWTGFSPMTYFILWVILPKAQTAAERLAMRGEPINVSNIAKTVEEEVQNISEAFRNPNGKDKNRTYGAQSTKGAGKAATDFMFFFKDIFNNIFNVLKMVGRPIVGLFGAFFTFVLGIFWMSFLAIIYCGYPFSGYLFGQDSITQFWFVVSVSLLFLIPLSWAIFGIMKLLFKVKPLGKNIKIGLLLVWILNCFGLSLLGAYFGNQFSNKSEYTQTINLEDVKSDTIEVLFENSKFHNNIQFWGSFIDENGLATPCVGLNIEKSTDNNFSLQQDFSSHGENYSEAESLSKAINYPMKLEGNKLILPGDLIIPKGTKWRVQKVEMKLFIPVGKYIRFDKNTRSYMERFDGKTTFRGKREYRNFRGESKVYQMQKNGELANNDDIKAENFSQSFENKNFNKIEIKGNLKVVVKQGKNYSITLKGDKDDIQKVSLRQSNETIYIDAKDDINDDDLVVEITLPNLEVLDIKDTKGVTIEGISSDKLELFLDGNMTVDADIEAKDMRIKLENDITLNIKGTAETLDVRLKDETELKGSRFQVNTCKVDAEDSASIEIYAKKQVKVTGDNGNVKVEGDAEVIRPDEN